MQSYLYEDFKLKPLIVDGKRISQFIASTDGKKYIRLLYNKYGDVFYVDDNNINMNTIFNNIEEINEILYKWKEANINELNRTLNKKFNFDMTTYV